MSALLEPDPTLPTGQVSSCPHLAENALRDGVTPSRVFIPRLPANLTVLQFLQQQFQHIPAEVWVQRMRDGLVVDAHGHALSPDTCGLPAQHIYYYRHVVDETDVPFQERILFENDHLLVVDKPHFLTVAPTGQYVQQTLLTRLKRSTGLAELSPIHRLDRETAGVLLLAKRAAVRAAYQRMFAERQISKTYHALAPYHESLVKPAQVALRLQRGEPFYTMQIVDGEPNSLTHLRLLDRQGDWGQYELRPVTGQMHQLRVHMLSLGIPILNDRLYPPKNERQPDDFNRPLQLVARRLEFRDPLSGEQLSFESGFNVDWSQCH